MSTVDYSSKIPNNVDLGSDRQVLRALERPQEADAVEKRAKDALLRNADREGRRAHRR